MAEYIERGVAIRELRDVYEREFPTASGAFDLFANRIVPRVIKSIPAAEVEPVVHGRWIWNENACTWDCSNCNGSVGAGSRISKYAHCPFCGARMDGGADNG